MCDPPPRLARRVRSSLAWSALAVVAASLACACGGARSSLPPDERAHVHESPPTATTGNAIVAYLRGAELQCESAQEANIHLALEDLATLPAATLRARRYRDYTGAPDAWDLPRVLRSHFVPDDPHHAGVVDDPAAFWAAADSDEVRALAREMLRALDAPSRSSPVLAP